MEMCCAVDGQEKRLVLSHKEYEDLCEPLLERLRKPLQRSIADAHVRLSDIDEVVLVGGATRMPVVRDFVVKLFHKFPDVTVHPDEAVALGAAVQGAMKSRNREVKEMILTDVCAFTLGVEVVMERREGVFEPGHFCPVIERNTVIPASRTERFYTVYNNQDRIRISVYQGESRLTANNLLLGSLEIQVPKNRAGREAVDVTYTYDINSILEVEVKVLSTGQVKRQIDHSQLSPLHSRHVASQRLHVGQHLFSGVFFQIGQFFRRHARGHCAGKQHRHHVRALFFQNKSLFPGQIRNPGRFGLYDSLFHRPRRHIPGGVHSAQAERQRHSLHRPALISPERPASGQMNQVCIPGSVHISVRSHGKCPLVVHAQKGRDFPLPALRSDHPGMQKDRDSLLLQQIVQRAF